MKPGKSNNMQWSIVEQYLKGGSSDLLEVYFCGIDHKSWRNLFSWIQEKVFLLDCQFGRLNANELNLDDFLDGKMSYIAHIKTPDGYELSLSIIKENELTIDIEVCEINTEGNFELFLNNVINIAEVINCNHYIICPEFEKDKAFIINGHLA